MTKDTPFGALVKHRRVALAISQTALADLVGRSASAVRSWERGSSTPSDETVVRSLAAILGLDEDELRNAAGMPPGVTVEEVEEIGGKGLEAFTDEAAQVGAAAPLGAEEVSWDDVAESVRTSVEPRSPADQAEAEAPGVDDSGDEHSADEPEGAEPEDSPGDEVPTEAAGDEPMVPSKEPDPIPVVPETAEVEPDPIPVLPDPAEVEPGPIPVVATTRAQPETNVPLVPTATTATSRTTVMQVGEPTAPPVANSYLDDPDQMMTYWIRAALTVALTMFLVIVLFWALGNLGDSIGEVWDLFKAAS
jgi:transcriptional regulator with XRE-family HTH domain